MVLIALLTFFSVLVGAPSQPLAQAYPERPIQIVVAFGPGGPNDLIARFVGDQLSKELKTPVAVLNKPGAGGALGAAFAAQAKKDGHTLFLTSHANYLTAVLQPKDVNYDMERDFEPIGKIAELASAVMVRSTAPWNHLTDLLNHIKKNPKKVSCGVAAVGTMPYFVWLTLNSLGFETNGVIVANSPEGVAYLKGGHVEMSIESVPPSAPHLRDRSFRGLAVTTAKRVKEFPDIPTFPEAGHPEIGYFPQFAGLYAPAGTPGPILQLLSSALQKTMRDQAVLDKLEKMNFSPDYQGPAEFKQMIASFVPRIRSMAEKAGIIK